jgi:type VI secretion system secreted protein VgrG
MSTLVKHDQTLAVHGDRSVTVNGNETQVFKGDRNTAVEGANTDAIFGAHEGTYYGGRTEVVENGDTLVVVGSHKTTSVDGEYNITANEHYRVLSGKNDTSHVDLKDGVATITAANEIKLVCGDASLSLKKDGTVVIQGKKSLSASGAEAKLELDSAGATLSGQKATVAGKTMTEISGDMVQIN